MKSWLIFSLLLFLSPLLAEDLTAGRVSLGTKEKAYLQALGPITVAPDPDWIPFEHVDSAGNFTGIAADLLELVAERVGIEFSYVIPRDWEEALYWSQSGDILILPFLNQTPAREEWLVFTEPLLVDPNVFITRQEHAFIYDARQLTNETIVFPAGTSMEERVRRDFPNLNIMNVESENDVFKAVVNGDADLTLRSLAVAAYTIRKEGLFNLKIAGQAPEEYTNNLRMGILKDQPMLRDVLNKGIATITPGEREAILNRHINITIVQPFDYATLFRVAGVILLLTLFSLYWNLRLKRINAALKESERSKSVLLSTLPGMAYRCCIDRDWTMEFVSEGCLDLTGYHSEELVNNSRVSYNSIIHPDDRAWVRERWESALEKREPQKLEYRIITICGSQKWVFEQGLFVDIPRQGPQIEGLIIDISDRKRAEEELYRISIHDHLTGLYNRAYLSMRLLQLAAEYQRSSRIFSVAMLDLDFFKSINDNFGHAAGDAVLREFTRLLSESFRQYDLIGRFGGEEFLVILLNTGAEEARGMMQRLQERVRQYRFSFDQQPLAMSFSAGLASASEVESSLHDKFWVDDLLARADKRLYAAKARGRDCLVFD